MQNSGAKPGDTTNYGSRNRSTLILPYKEHLKQSEKGRCVCYGLAMVRAEKNIRVDVVILTEDEKSNDEGEITKTEAKEMEEMMEPDCKWMDLSMYPSRRIDPTNHTI